ncbi:MAG: 3-deoxy-D-manno-octulosonic acid transferase [Cytophagales bacterium]|nr:3-deoxy-D-manno-octulosonic acid transferase [Cytophagales bacterium]
MSHLYVSKKSLRFISQLSLFFYNISIRLYHLAIIIASSFNPKAKKWIIGRKGIFDQIKLTLKDNNSPIAWFHCASLGEFEQARPVIEKWKMSPLTGDHPKGWEDGKWKILLTFFSPSGYEVRKDYELADFVFYLPIDSKKNAERFVEIVQPKIVFFVKYEFWYHYLNTLKKNNIPVILFSAIFRTNQLFFKPHGGFYRKMLSFFQYIFVQDQISYDLLKNIGINNLTIAGDTRFDRVKTICDNKKEIPIVEQFKAGEKLLIIGSSWPEDMKILIPFINNFNKQLKIVIAPHEIGENEIEKLQSRLFHKVSEEDILHKINKGFNNKKRSLKWLQPTEGFNSPSVETTKDFTANIRKQILKVQEKTQKKHFRKETADCIRYSMLNKQNAAKYKVLIIDNIGMLSSLYQYADFAYIGGAFGLGLHNILEAATFGMPIFFGPNYKKFHEAVDLVASGAAFSIKNTKEFEKQFKANYENDELRANKASIARNYVLKNTGAAEKIFQITNDEVRMTRG